MERADSKTLDKVSDILRWEEALRIYARIQIGCVERIDRLLALGCSHLPLNKLAAGINSLFADTSAMLPGHPAGLSETEIAELRTLAPQFKGRCDELAGYGLPHTLEHGDFWAGQILVGDDNYVFIDWSDSSVSHPFFSLLFFLAEENELPGGPNVRTRLRNAYLEPWTIYAPMDRLIEAFELSQPLAALHHAIMYHRVILPNMEIKWEMENMLPYFLKILHHKV